MTHCYGSLAESTPLQDWEKKDSSQSTSADSVFSYKKSKLFTF